MNNDLVRSSVSVTLVGSGGAGVMTAGKLLLEAAAKAGWYGVMTRSFGPQIRGGEAAALVRLSTRPVETHDDHFDILLAIDWSNFDRFAGEIPLAVETLVIADPDAGDIPDTVKNSGASVVDLPIQALITEVAGARANMIALGAVAKLIGIPLETVDELIGKRLARKGLGAVTTGEAAVNAGAVAAQGISGAPRLAGDILDSDGRWLITGNEAAGLGAIRGGVRFVAAYPITPATDLMEWMAPQLAKVGGTLVQAEDELASMNMVIGASFGGTPSLTATSGPGFSLMTESIGLAIASEVPVVVVDVMRCGPSTGIATKSEQSDLNIAVYGFHGDAPHLVVAPLSVADCLFTTQWATHLADAMQTAAIVLSDQYLGQAQVVLDRPADIAFVAQRETAAESGEPYLRYANTASGISPMACPGTPGNEYTADGLEHNERGIPSTLAEVHATQLDKRNRKLAGFDYGQHWAEIEGEGELAIITWGSSTVPAREALARAAADGVSARLIGVRLIAPARPEQMAEALDGVKRVLVVEQSHSGQFHRYLRAEYDLPDDVGAFHRPGPLPMRAGDIYDAIREWV
ncbi:MAG: 2-oxoacid:acceptor oxidoreductase subunit alpha [Sphingomonadales bacterium]